MGPCRDSCFSARGRHHVDGGKKGASGRAAIVLMAAFKGVSVSLTFVWKLLKKTHRRPMLKSWRHQVCEAPQRSLGNCGGSCATAHGPARFDADSRFGKEFDSSYKSPRHRRLHASPSRWEGGSGRARAGCPEGPRSLVLVQSRSVQVVEIAGLLCLERNMARSLFLQSWANVVPKVRHDDADMTPRGTSMIRCVRKNPRQGHGIVNTNNIFVDPTLLRDTS